MTDPARPAHTPGCYIDSHHGHYAIPTVIELAAEAGFTLDPFAAFTLASYPSHYSDEGYPNEAIIELSDEAIAWLNEHRPLEGHVWEWNDGDFGLYPCERDEDEESIGTLGMWSNDA